MKKILFVFFLACFLVVGLSAQTTLSAEKLAQIEKDKAIKAATPRNSAISTGTIYRDETQRNDTRINTFPWTEGFDGTTWPPAGWLNIDDDADNPPGDDAVKDKWMRTTGFTGGLLPQAGDGMAGSSSWYDSNNFYPLHPNNWLISPVLEVPANASDFVLRYYSRLTDETYPDRMGVYVSTTGTTIGTGTSTTVGSVVGDFTLKYYDAPSDDAWTQRTIDLSSYAGQSIYIGFRHYNSDDNDWVLLDEVYVGANVVNPPKPLPYTQNFNSGTSFPAIDWETTNMNTYSGILTGSGVGSTNAAVMNLWSSTATTTFTSPRVGAVSDAAKLSFAYKLVEYTSSWPGTGTSLADLGTGTMNIEISKDDGATWINVHTINNLNHVVSNQYRTIDVNVIGHETDGIKFRFRGVRGTTGDYMWCIDDVTFKNSLARDLVAGTLTRVGHPVAGNTHNYTFNVINEGASDVPAHLYYVSLKVDGRATEIVTLPGVALNSGANSNFTLPWTPALAGEYQVFAEVIFANDMDQTNNKSAIQNVIVNSPNELVATSFTLNSAFVMIEEPASFTFRITNLGNPVAAGSYNVKLYRETVAPYYTELASIPGVAIASNTFADVPLTWIPTAGGEFKVYAYIDYSLDGNTSNNTSNIITTNVFTEPPTITQIGNGTSVGSTSWAMPIDDYYRHSISQTIYLKSEFVDIMKPELITKLAWQWNGGSAPNADEIEVWMGHTPNAAHASTTFIPKANLTKVYAGPISLPSTVSWSEINLDTPFEYNYADNLVITVIETKYGTSYGSGSAQFYNFAVTSNRSLTSRSDTQNYYIPDWPAAGTYRQFVPNLRVTFPFAQPPMEPYFMITPEERSFGNQQINVASAPQTFTITNKGMSNLVIDSFDMMGTNATDFVVNSTLTFPLSLPFNQTATFTVAFNPATVGDKTATIVIKDNITRAIRLIPLTGTGVDLRISQFPYLYDFTATTFPPAVPTTWTRASVRLPANGDPVTLNTTAGNWAYNANFAHVTGHPNGGAARIPLTGTTLYSWLITPEVVLSNLGTTKFLEFDLALTGNGTATAPATTAGTTDDRFIVIAIPAGTNEVSNSNIVATWDNASSTRVLNSIPHTGQKISLNVSSLTGNYRFAFYAESVLNSPSATNHLFVDNIAFRATANTTPAIAVSPTSASFGSVNTNAIGTAQVFTITNTGSGNLNVTSLNIQGLDAADFDIVAGAITSTQTIAPFGTYTFSVNFIPLTAGDKIANVVINNNVNNVTIPLSGIALVPFPGSTVQVGTGTTTISNIPISASSALSGSQVIYLASELGTANAGKSITSISYFWRGGVAAPNSNFWNVHIAHTNNTNFAATGADTWIKTGFSKHFAGTVDLSLVSGGYWLEIPLDPPFIWNGTQNLVVEVIENTLTNAGNGTTTTAAFTGHSVGTGVANQRSKQVAYGAQSGVIDFTQSLLWQQTGGSVTGNRPNTLFKMIRIMPPSTPIATPGIGQISLAWTAPEAGSDLELLGYKIVRDGTTIATVGPTDLTFVDTTVVYPVVYKYAIVAAYGITDSWSDYTDGIMPDATTEIPFPPRNLTYQINGNNVALNWLAPLPQTSGTFTHTQSAYAISYGSNAAAINWNAAHRFTRQHLYDLSLIGNNLTQVSIYLNSNTGLASITELNLRVWHGSEAGGGTPVVDIPVPVSSLTNGDWSTITLPTPIPITGTQEIWIGYNIQAPSAYFAVAVDGGPVVSGFGEMFSAGGGAWETFGAGCNFMIRGHAVTPSGEPVEISQISYEDTPSSFTTKSISTNRFASEEVFVDSSRNSETTTSRALVGYNAYRGDTLLTTTPITALTYTDANPPTGVHTYRVRAVYTADLLSTPISVNVPFGFPAPTNVSASTNLKDVIGIVWTAPTVSPDVVIRGYNIYRNGTRIVQNHPTNSYIDTNIVNYTEYTYHVTTVYSTPVAESAPSNTSIGVGRDPQLPSPQNLTAKIVNNNAVLNWDAAGAGMITFDQNSEPRDGIGNATATDFEVYHRFTPYHLEDMLASGMNLSRISFVHYQAGNTYQVRILTRTSAQTEPVQIYSQDVTQTMTVGAWVDVDLTTPYLLPNDREVWIGYQVALPAGGARASCDAGPMVDRFGNMMKWGGSWMTMFEAGGAGSTLTYNWSIRGYVSNPSGSEPVVLGTLNLDATYPDWDFVTFGNGGFETMNAQFGFAHSSIPTSRNISRDTSETYRNNGFNVYGRNTQVAGSTMTLLTATPITTNTYTHNGAGSGAWIYNVTSVYSTGESTPSTFDLSKPIYVMSPANGTFDQLFAGETSSREFTIANNGVGEIIVASANITGGGHAAYNVTDMATLPIFLTAGTSSTFTLNFAPTTVGTFVGSLELGTSLGVQTLALTGTARGPMDNLIPPTGLAATVVDRNVTLTWVAPAGDEVIEEITVGRSVVEKVATRVEKKAVDNQGTRGFIRYNIYRNDSLVGNTQNLTYTDANSPYGVHTYKVAAVYDDGMADTDAVTVGVGYEAPTALVATGGNTTVTLTWTAPTAHVGNIANYTIYRDGAQVGTSTTATFTNTGLVNGTGYVFAVKATFANPAWESPLSATVIGVPMPGEEQDNIQPVTNLVGTPSGYYVTLTWTAPAGITSNEDDEDEDGGTRAFLGYEIKRDGVVVGMAHASVTTYGNMTPNTITTPTTYVYSVVAQYTSGNSAPVTVSVLVSPVSEGDHLAPVTKTDLRGNYPNPFNPTTTISFDVLNNNEYVTIDIYNSKGQKVTTLVDGNYSNGRHSATWYGNDDTGRNVGSGVYFYRMQSGDYVSIKRMVLMK